MTYIEDTLTPFVAHTQLREIAPEYYEDRYYHTSWCWVIFKFITDPDMGPWSRMRRKTREGPLDKLMGATTLVSQ